MEVSGMTDSGSMERSGWTRSWRVNRSNWPVRVIGTGTGA
jgi:hypothetical protein